MAQRNVWDVVFDSASKQWQVIREGGKRASSRHDRKDDAVAAAVGYAQNNAPGQVRIHKTDGTLQSERTYGSDPAGSKG